MITEVELILISFDVNYNAPIIFLREKTGEHPRRVLPIWIGIPEAAAISLKINKEKSPRPMTHDLMLDIIDHFGAAVKAIIVHSIKKATFYGKIVLERKEQVIEIDSRPSDAIALALRAEAPIFVDEEILKNSELTEDDLKKMEKDTTKKILENMDEDTLDKLKV